MSNNTEVKEQVQPMNEGIKDVLEGFMNSGVVEELITEQLKKGITSALDNMFRSYGDVTKVIETKIKSVLVPYLETYDYSEYILKLDDVLVNILKETSSDHKKLLENFQRLMLPVPGDSITTEALFDRWIKHVEKNVETNGLDVCYDDGVSYESVEVTYRIEYIDTPDWSSFSRGVIYFECEHDPEMNFELSLSKYNGDKKELWSIEYGHNDVSIRSLRYLNDFSMYLMSLDQAGVKLEITGDYDQEDVTPDKEPEATFA